MGQIILANFKIPCFLPIFALFLPIRFRKKPNHPFLRLKLYFPSKPHRFLKKRSIFLGKSVIWPIWPNLAYIWPNLAFMSLGLVMYGNSWTTLIIWTGRLEGFFVNLKPVEISKNHSNIIWSSLKVVLILKIWRM